MSKLLEALFHDPEFRNSLRTHTPTRPSVYSENLTNNPQ